MRERGRGRGRETCGKRGREGRGKEASLIQFIALDVIDSILMLYFTIKL